MTLQPPRSTLFPYTTLFRSADWPSSQTSFPGVDPHRAKTNPHRRSEEHTSELQSQSNLVCRLLLEKKKKYDYARTSTNFAVYAMSPLGPAHFRTLPRASTVR